MNPVCLVTVAALAAIPCASLGAYDEFEAAVNSVGQPYEEARDRLLRSPDFGVVAKKLRSESARERLTAIILQGYREHAEEFTGLRAQKLVDQRGGTRFRWASDPRQLRPDHLPLLYEFLLKDVEGASGRVTAIRLIGYLARHGTTPDVEGLKELVGSEGLPQASRAACAGTLAALPSSMVKTDDLLKLLKAEVSRVAKNPSVSIALIDGVVSASAELSETGKDAVVEKLNAMDGLKQLIGEPTIARVVGGVGGPKAVPVVARYLDRAQTQSQAVWAISTLGSLGDAAVGSLLNYVADEKDRPSFKILAIQELSNFKYNNQIGKRLSEVVREGRRTVQERAEALEALSKLHESSPRDGEARRDIISHLQTLENSVTDAAIRLKVQQTKEGALRLQENR